MEQQPRVASTMQRKKLDSRIPLLIANCVKTNHRSFFILVGDRGKDQIVTLHFLLSKARVTVRPSVLWCYKKELGFTTHKKKRINQIKRDISRGIREADAEDPFELFVTATDIRYSYYKDTESVLGNTYGMCVLQDFEAITPNILARTVETVEGGGIVVILLKTMHSLKQLYTMTMDVHARYRTESHHDTVARFNERFLLSLGTCSTCLVLDDELNVLPISAGKDVKPLAITASDKTIDKELADLKASLADTQPIGTLVGCARTTDQAKAVLTFVEAIAEKTMQSTVALTAARGRGKSAALGISLASAVAYGYSNIFITAPSPENLNTLFEFCIKALVALGYEEHLDYDIVKSVVPAMAKCTMRVNIFREHRQTIQYIAPTEYQALGQAELLVIDEAAAIPLPVIKKLLGPYLVFMASTINGYEGTGKSLSLKLFKQLREQSLGFSTQAKTTTATTTSRTLREIQLETPIRYAPLDPVEKWLNGLLCLDTASTASPLKSLSIGGLPHPSLCELYYVNKDTLFSYHPVGESFLQRMMNLYTSSHYKNTPNDLQLMSDAPAHHLFVLLPPITSANAHTLPDPIVVIQVCLEGKIAKENALAALRRGLRQSGDLIPWVVSQQFQEGGFAGLSGGRVVRVATHEAYCGMGYGRRAIELCEKYYTGGEISLEEEDVMETEVKETKGVSRVGDVELENLLKEQIKIKDPSSMPPLLVKLSERPLKKDERLDWFGVSYGLTPQLLKFWKRMAFVPVYIRQTANELTGEHTCIMVKCLKGEVAEKEAMTQYNQIDQSWLRDFSQDFKKRFMQLLSYQLSIFTTSTALSIFESVNSVKAVASSATASTHTPLDTKQDISRFFTPYDLKRLASYSQNLLDYHVIQDLLPTLAQLYFSSSLTSPTNQTTVTLSAVQSAILCGMGLQKKSVDDLERELVLSSGQILALLAKVVRKCSGFFEGVVTRSVREELEASGAITRGVEYEIKTVVNENGESGDEDAKEILVVRERKAFDDDAAWDPTLETLEDDLNEGERTFMKALKAKQTEVIDSLDLSLYNIQGGEKEWDSVKLGDGKSIVNIASSKSTKKRKPEALAADLGAELRGEKTGVYDPKGLAKKEGKAKKAKKEKK